MLTDAGLKDSGVSVLSTIIERDSLAGSKSGSACSGSGSEDTAEKESYIRELERKLKNIQSEGKIGADSNVMSDEDAINLYSPRQHGSRNGK